MVSKDKSLEERKIAIVKRVINENGTGLLRGIENAIRIHDAPAAPKINHM